MKVIDVAEDQWAGAVSALSAGDFRRAGRVLDGVYLPFFSPGLNYRTMLQLGLSARESGTSVMFPSYLFANVFNPTVDRFALLRAEVAIKRGSLVDVPFAEVSEFPNEVRKSIATDPNFESLRKQYAFRVLSGLQEPISLDNINLPDVRPPCQHS
jgi:hypothetical protein